MRTSWIDQLPAWAVATIGIVAFIVAVFWILFPVIMWAKANEILREAKKIREAAEDIEKNTRGAGRKSGDASSVKYEWPR